MAAMELVKIIRQHRLGTGWKSVGWKRFRLCSEGKLKKTHWILTLVHKNAETARKMRASSRKWLGSTLCPDRTDNCKLLLHLLCVCAHKHTSASTESQLSPSITWVSGLVAILPLCHLVFFHLQCLRFFLVWLLLVCYLFAT